MSVRLESSAFWKSCLKVQASALRGDRPLLLDIIEGSSDGSGVIDRTGVQTLAPCNSVGRIDSPKGDGVRVMSCCSMTCWKVGGGGGGHRESVRALRAVKM